MISFTLPILLLSLAATSLAQTAPIPANSTVSTASIPGCAVACTISSLPGTDCAPYGISNLTCICTATNFATKFYNCQAATCSPAELVAAKAYGDEACLANRTPINITATPSGVTVTGASATKAASASTASGSVAPAATTAAKAAGMRLGENVGILGLVVGGVALLL